MDPGVDLALGMGGRMGLEMGLRIGLGGTMETGVVMGTSGGITLAASKPGSPDG